MLGMQAQGQSGLTSILDKAKSFFNFSSFNFNSFFDADQQKEGSAGSDLLSSIFGSGLSGIVSSLTSFLGIKGDSVTKLLGVSLPAVFSSLTDKGTNWNVGSITSLLNTNKDSLLGALPAGLGLASLGGIASSAKGVVNDMTDTATKTISKVTHEIPLSYIPSTRSKRRKKVLVYGGFSSPSF